MKTQQDQYSTPYLLPTELPGTSHRYVLTLDEQRCCDLRNAGGKGSSLASLRQQGFPVPAGLVISSDSYDEFLRPVFRSLESLLKDWDADRPGAAADLSTQARKRLEALVIPAAIDEELRSALLRFPSNQGFAVRSSSTLEDLSGAAFAGMHETWLNCHGLPRLLETIRCCYLSLWSERAITYRQHKGFHHLDSRMAVVIQAMVDCEVAGVGFSVHPVTGDLQTMVVNANFGLGDSVVNGEHEVDHLELDKTTGSVSRSIPGQKKTKVVCDPVEGGIREVALDAATGSATCLTSWQIDQLSALMLRVEEATGFPQDIEWGFAKGAVHLFQARPITSIPPRWTRDESAERFPNVMTPLSWDLVDEGFHKSLDHSLDLMGLPSFDGQWFASHDHYIYGNQNAVELYLGRAPFLINNFDDLREVIPDLRSRYRWVQDLPATWSRDLDKFLLGVGRLASQPVEEWNDMPRLWNQIMEISRVGNEYFLPNIAISITQSKLHRVLFHLLSLAVGESRTPELFDSLLAFCETTTWEINRELYDLAVMADQNDNLKATILKEDSRHIIDSEILSRFPEFGRSFESLIERHGHREPELDAYHATWIEVPWIVLDHVRLMLRSLQTTTPPVRKERTLRTRMLQAEVILFAALPEDLHYFFRELLRLTRLYTGLDDREHYQTTRLTPVLRRAVRSFGSRLVEDGHLDDPMDVFFARKADLEAAVASNDEAGWQTLATIINSAKEVYQRDEARRPEWILGEQAEDTNLVDSESGDQQILRGIPASSGQIEGVVCQVWSEADFSSVPEGAILVARTTNPSWTPLFHAAAGVITESGGPLSHGAITAREMHIPAVMAVRDAMLKLPTGQRVRLNGTSGEIQIL